MKGIWKKKSGKLSFTLYMHKALTFRLEDLDTHGHIYQAPYDLHRDILLCSTQIGLASQLKEGKTSQIQIEYKESASEVPKFGNVCSTPAEDSQVKVQACNFGTHANKNLVSECLEGAESDLEDGWNQMDALTTQPSSTQFWHFVRNL